MLSPSIRPNANRIDKHHLNFRRKDWINTSDIHRQVRELGAFSISLPRHWHDRIHTNIEPLRPPVQSVAIQMYNIGEAHSLWADDVTRIESMLDDMATYARSEVSPEKSDGMLEVMTNYSAQLGALTLMNTIRSIR
jgi:hypothetical protein